MTDGDGSGEIGLGQDVGGADAFGERSTRSESSERDLRFILDAMDFPSTRQGTQPALRSSLAVKATGMTLGVGAEVLASIPEEMMLEMLASSFGALELVATDEYANG